MVSQELRKLVGDANSSIVDTGRLRDGWLEQYQTTLEKASALYDGPSWPKDVFASLHYISTHLCLRYHARKEPVSARNSETESTLGKIHLETDLFLWTAVSRLPHWDAEPLIRADEAELISLCFSDLSPVQPVTEESSFIAWKKAYQETLRKLETTVRRADHWPKWLCNAFHFATFYVDLYQQQVITLDDEITSATSNTLISSLTSRLAAYIENQRVLRLIEVWLESANISRNSSGIPVLGESRPRTDRFISVRGTTELFVQSCVGTAHV